jgi:O-acetyl-ADP-ribose deacetylase (regulator of RNase III)
MQKSVNMGRIELYKGDITKQEVCAIVNAANESLLGGGGVDGAIHRAAGPELLEECKTLNGCETGNAKMTKGYNLPAKHVIHAVGPVWKGGNNNEPQLLASCYRNSLSLASENNLKTIAFPNISTGVYGYPKQEAAKVAIQTVKEYLASDDTIEQIIFTVFDEENYAIYEQLLDM